MFKLTNIILVFALILLFTAGCSEQNNPTGSTASTKKEAVSAESVVIPAGASLDSAKIFLTVSMTSSEAVSIHRITADWNEMDVTWNSFNGSYDNSSEASFTPESYGQTGVGITPLAEAWFDGAEANYGIVLRQVASVSQYRSCEYGELAARPRLELYTSTQSGAETFVIQETGAGEVEDAFIGGNFPTGNNGAAPMLMVGNSFGFEQQSLIRFNFVVEEAQEELAAIGDRVWEDLNSDGIQDAGEPGIADVRIDLYGCDGRMIEGALTDAEGYYLFDSLSLGEYYLVFHAPGDYLISLPDQGSDDADSDAEPSTGETVCFILDSAGSYTGWDAGFYLPAIEEDNGCTHGLHYWKRQCNFRQARLNNSEIDSYLPIWLGTEEGRRSLKINDSRDARRIFFLALFWRSSNGIIKLYPQLLTAKLNIAAGADDEAIADAILEADQFLAEHGFLSWYKLNRDERKQLIIWKNLFRSFNNGKIGPGSCAEDQGGIDIEIGSNR
jgi:hypothetical protein